MEKNYYKIKLEYFDDYGNYCGAGIIRTEKLHMFEIYEEVKFLKDNHLLPNISSNRDIIIYINGENHPNGFPMLYGLEYTKCINNLKTVMDIDLKADEDDIVVQLEYFKPSGKYYADDEIIVSEFNTKKIVESIRQHKNTNTLPEIRNSKEFIVYISIIQDNKIFKQIIF